MRNIFTRLVLPAMLLLTPFALRAQDAAALTGIVTDATGAVIPDTLVTLTNTLTGATFTQTTDNKGSYKFAKVPPNASYKVTFTHSGFSTAEVTDITLNVSLTRTQDAKLIAGKNETVEVSASNQTVTLNTTDATIGNNMDVHQLNELPIQDRTLGVTTLFTQQAGVDSNSGAVTGARIDQTAVSVDGLDVNDLATGQAFAITANAPIDSVEQFTGSIAGLNAALGTGSGGEFELVTKSGTNKFHGNINEYHRDTSTAANTWFNNNVGLPRTPLIRNQFGGNIGGPVIIPRLYNGRDKLFFFFEINDSRIIQSASAEPTVPLNSFRAGMLNYINSGPGCTDSSRINTQPACITTLTGAQVTALDPAHMGIDAGVLAFINSRYPVANDLTHGDGVNTGGFRFSTPTPNIDTTYINRIDYQLSASHRLSGRFTINRQNSISALPEFPTDPLTHPLIDRSYGYVVSDTWAIGKNKVNAFSYGDNISKLSFPDLFNPTGANQYSFTGFSGPYTQFNGQIRRIPIPVVRDDFSWQRGSHGITFGGTFKFIKTNTNLVNNFNFVGGGLTGDGLSGGLAPDLRPADIQQGTASSGQVAINDYDKLFATDLGVVGSISTNYNFNNAAVAQPAGSGGPRAYRYYETEMYIGDTWKVNKQLTLSYGLRYQLYSVPYEVHGEESVSSPFSLDDYIQDRLAQSQAGASGNNTLPFYSYILGGKANHGPNLYKPSYDDIAPRVAFAYNPAWSPKTVINGSAGIVYDRTVISAVNNLQDQASYLFSNTSVNQFGASSPEASLATAPRLGANLAYSSSLNPAPQAVTSPFIPFVDNTGTPFGLADGQSSFIISPLLKDPYSIALNFGIQREIPGHMVLKASYVGRLGRRLLADADASQVIDFPDLVSGQMMSAAFASVTTQLRAGAKATSQAGLVAAPWFENVVQPGLGQGFGFANNTSLVADLIAQYGPRGDISDALATLAGYTYFNGLPILPTNVGIPSQFGTNAYLTNQGNSNYHGLLLTLDKNLSQGLRFTFNYTFAHSIDNTSLSANNNALFTDTGLICDVLKPRACRGSSDFDVRQEVTSNFTYDLPVGHGKMFMSSSPRWVDEAIGGWSVSGLPSYRTGLALQSYSDAFLASFDNADPSIFIGANKNDVAVHINKSSSGTLYAFAGGAAGATKALSEFRGPIGLEYGQRNFLRGPGAFALDMGLAKRFAILQDKGVNLTFRADAFNVLNHPAFANQAVNIVTNASQFGQISGVAIAARVAQFSLRLEF
jgi:hypothetical protein